MTVTTKLLVTIATVLLLATTGAGVYYLNETGQINWFSKTIEIPDLVGKSKEEVESWVQANELEADFVAYSYVYDNEMELDHVVSQSVEANKKIKRSEHLDLDISGGKDPDQEFILPDFKGQSMKEVAEWFTSNDFKLVSYAFKKDPSLEKDQFISCEPNVGETVKRNTKIVVTFSSGDQANENEEVTVPDFKPYTYNEMQKWGKENRISLVFDFEFDDKIGKGQYIKQSIKPNATMKAGEKIVITISNGKSVGIESFIGKTRKDAEAWCKQNNVKPVFIDVYAKEKQGTIVAQSVTKGNITKDSKITFSLAAGPVPLQNYVGRTKDEFNGYIAWLNNEAYKSAKLTFEIVEVDANDKKPGTILEQNPNTPCNPGTKVTIKIAKIGKVTVENKKNSTEQDFKTYLSNLGLQLGNRVEEYSNDVSSGKIINNSTGTFDRGTSINYTVSKGAYSFDPTPYLKEGTAFNHGNFAEAKNHGWTVNVVEDFNSTLAAGTIVSSSVNGKQITVTLSKGKDPRIDVVSVIGQDVETAKQTLANRGFTNIVAIQADASDEPANKVIAQNPTSGKYDANQQIMLTYSPGKPEVQQATIPDIQVDFFAAADRAIIESGVISKIRGAGFTNVRVVEKNTLENNPNNYSGLESINPAPGTTLPVDSEITVTILVPR